MNIAVWHCYDYGPAHTYVLLAETEDALRAKVREAISYRWDKKAQGPMPEDFDELLEMYTEWDSDLYFGDWGYTVINTVYCEPVEEQEL
jgi:hypothetical protein